MDAAEFVRRAELAGFKHEKHGQHWRLQCPGHAGTDLNLDVSDGAKGVLVKCHSHDCPVEDICQGVGVTTEELFYEKREAAAAGPVTVFPYRDEDRQVLYEIRRSTDAFGKKQFLAYQPGEEKPGIKDVRRVLLGLPELLMTPPGGLVCIAEGEKCALAVAKLGLPCTTNPFGAGKWLPEYSEWLAEHLPGRRFLVLPDNDEEGKKHALCVCDSLQAMGLKVFLADLGTLPPRGDVVQWIFGGGTADRLREMAVDQPPRLWARIRSFEALLLEPSPGWLIEDLFMEETMAELYGAPGAGKSFVAVDACMALRRGGTWCGRRIDRTGPILYISADGGLGFADRARAWALIHGRSAADEEFWTLPEPINLFRAESIAALGEVLAYMPKKPLVMAVDTYSRCIPGVNENLQEPASMVVDNLTSLMREFHFSTWLIHHADATGMKARGSSVIIGACDTQIRLSMTRERVIAMTCEKQRDAPDFEPVHFHLGRFPGSNEVWVNWLPESSTGEEIRMARSDDAKVLAAIRRDPGITRRALYVGLELSETTLKRIVNRLLEAEKIEEKTLTGQEGKRGPKEEGLFPLPERLELG